MAVLAVLAVLPWDKMPMQGRCRRCLQASHATDGSVLCWAVVLRTVASTIIT